MEMLIWGSLAVLGFCALSAWWKRRNALNVHHERESTSSSIFCHTPYVHEENGARFPMFLDTTTRELGIVYHRKFSVIRPATPEEVKESLTYDWYRTT